MVRAQYPPTRRALAHSLPGVTTRTETLLAGEYFLAVEGFAMIRTCLTHPSAARPRVEEIRGILDRFDEFPQSLAIPMTEHGVEDGYTHWAPRYDGPNPAIEAETVGQGRLVAMLRDRLDALLPEPLAGVLADQRRQREAVAEALADLDEDE